MKNSDTLCGIKTYKSFNIRETLFTDKDKKKENVANN